jgi:hypothetical protein
MWLYGLIGLGLAGQTIILEDKTQIDNFQSDLDPNAQVLLWGDVFLSPLTYKNIASSQNCQAMSTTAAQLQDSLKKAEQALNYHEIDKAIGYIHRIQNDMICLNEKLPVSVISSTYFLLGVAHYYNEDFDQSNESWKQALLYDSDMQWDPNIEPSGQANFDSIKSEMQSEATARVILVPQSAQLTIDGQVAVNGREIFSGSHLLQQDSQEYQANLVNIETGADAYIVSFADFDEDLSSVMADELARQELLVGLQILIPDQELRIIENNRMWYLPLGAQRWRAQEQGESTSTNTAKKSRSLNKPLLIAGGTSLLLGGGAFYLASVAQDDFSKFTYYTEEAANTHRLNRMSWYTGAGLTAVGGTLMVLGTISF